MEKTIEELKGGALSAGERRQLKQTWGAGIVTFLGSTVVFGWKIGAAITYGVTKMFSWISKKVKKSNAKKIKSINKEKQKE